MAFKSYARGFYSSTKDLDMFIQCFNVWEGMGDFFFLFFSGVVTDGPQNTQVQIKMPSITNRDQKSATYQFLKAKHDVLTFLGLM